MTISRFCVYNTVDNNSGIKPESVRRNMEFIAWMPEYELGIEEIDKQHKKLCGIINDVCSAVAEHSEESEIFKLLDELLDYTQYHFKSEEQFLQQYNYPGFEEHKAEHDRLSSIVMDKEKEYISMGDPFSPDMMNYLKEWFLKHTQGTDRKYLPFIKK